MIDLELFVLSAFIQNLIHMVAWSNVQVIHIRACDLLNLLELPPGLKAIQSGNFPRIFLSQALRRKGVLIV